MMSLIVWTFLLTTPLFATTSQERLEALVSINSGSENIQGVNKVQDIAKAWMEELKFKVDLIENPEGSKKSGKLLVATMEGDNPRFITFIMHADTVFEPSSSFQKIKKINDDKLNGPGVIDNKGGIVVSYLALKEYLMGVIKPKYSLRILISPNEEVGSLGFGPLFTKFSADSFMVLGLEPAHEYGIVHSRKGNMWFEIEVKGKEAHAGRHHKDGVNACQILSDKITQLKKITDYKKEVTVSIGHMEGGQNKFNIVCGSAKAKLDVRTPSLKLRRDTFEKIDKILKSPGVSYSINDDTAPYSMNSSSKKYVDRYLEIIKKIEGTKVKGHASGGSGDTNYFSREGIIILDGLGPMGDEIHTENEYISLKTIDTRGRILAAFLRSL